MAWRDKSDEHYHMFQRPAEPVPVFLFDLESRMDIGVILRRRFYLYFCHLIYKFNHFQVLWRDDEHDPLEWNDGG